VVVVPIVDGLVEVVVDVLTVVVDVLNVVVDVLTVVVVAAVVVDVLVPPRSTIRLKPTDGNEFCSLEDFLARCFRFLLRLIGLAGCFTVVVGVGVVGVGAVVVRGRGVNLLPDLVLVDDEGVAVLLFPLPCVRARTCAPVPPLSA